jgi:hypothetical protein
VLDVDETGLIDVVSATTNQPISASVICRPGDVLVSCINPRIWRVAVIPEIDAAWTCSTEFLVLRPKCGNDPWAIAVAMHHASVIDRVQRMAGGTSSSRQRVPKELLLDVDLPLETLRTADTKSHRERRTAFYKLRLQEAKAYGALHQGDTRFELEGSALTETLCNAWESEDWSDGSTRRSNTSDGTQAVLDTDTDGLCRVRFHSCGGVRTGSSNEDRALLRDVQSLPAEDRHRERRGDRI